LRPDDILDQSVVDVIRKQLEQTFVMTNEVPFRELSFRHVFGDAQDPSWFAMLIALGDDFSSMYPSPPTVTMPHPTFAVEYFMFRKIRVIPIAMPTEVSRVGVNLEELQTLADNFRRIVPEKVRDSSASA
jgi:hypothetical protein